MTRQNAIPLITVVEDDAVVAGATTSTTTPSDGTTSGTATATTTATAAAAATTVASTEVESQTPALIPFWDLANHIDGHVTTSYNDNKHQIEATTLAAVRKGEQIFIHYGNRSNANLLVHNG